MSEKFAGAICGGNRQEAEKILEKQGHCEKHKKFNDHCEECKKKFGDVLDSVFMAIM